MNNVFKQVKRTFAVLSALFITVVTSKARDHHSECGPERLVHCSAPLTALTNSGLTFASNKTDLDKMCPDLQEALRCIHGYARRCMTREQYVHFKQLLNGTHMMVRDLCENESYQEKYLTYVPCMKKVEKQNEICLIRYARTMKEIESRTQEETTAPPDLVTYQKRKREAADEGIRSVCCAFQHYVDCSTHSMRRACGEDAAQFSREFLDKMSSAFIRLHCREFGQRECDLMMPAGADPLNLSLLVVTLLSFLVYYIR